MKLFGLLCLSLLLCSSLLYAGARTENSTSSPPLSQDENKDLDLPDKPSDNPNPGRDNSLPNQSPMDVLQGQEPKNTIPVGADQGTQAAPQPVQEPPKNQGPLPRLAILPFTGAEKTDGDHIALLLSNDKTMREAFTVLSFRSSNMPPIKESNSAFTDTDTISAIGKQLNADFVLTGHIKKLGNRNLIIITLVKVENFQQVAGGYRAFNALSDIRLLLPDMAKKIVEAMKFDTAKMPTLAVLPFSIPTDGISTQDAEVLIQLLTIEIANSGEYAVLPRTETIEKVLKVVETLRSELNAPDSIKAVGKDINAQYVLTGNIIHLGNSLHLFLAQILNVESAALRYGGDVEYRTITDGMQLIPELASKLTGIEAGMPSISIPSNMVWVAGGSFEMGNTKGDGDEQPVHTVQVSSFFMGKTQVTQKEYEAIMKKNPSYFKGDDLPVESVTWYDAVEYCNKLSKEEGLIPAYHGSNDNITCDFTANGYRLPTEAEWEYAARGGNRDTLTFEYSGGNSIDILGWYKKNSDDMTHDVGTKIVNSLGLYDMTGNVWEWCWDYYGDYQAQNQQDPRGVSLGVERIVRGGSWNVHEEQRQRLRSTYRGISKPSESFRDLGFRVLRPIF